MNVRNVGIVFAPTLNIPAPLISFFLTDYEAIFGDPLPEEQASPVKDAMYQQQQQGGDWDGIRSPRKQMFTELPTPAYNQTAFQGMGGFTPMQQPQGTRQMHTAAPNGFGGTHAQNEYVQQLQLQPQTQPQQYQDVGYGSLNGAMAPPPQPQQSSRDAKKARRESNMQMLMPGYGGGGPQGVGGSLAQVLSEQRKGSYQSLRSGSGSREGRGSPARR